MIKVESKFQSTSDSLSIDTYPDPSGFSYSPEDQTYFLVKNTPDYLMVYFEFEGAQTARQLLIGGGRSPGGGGFRGPPGGGSPSGGFRGNSRQNQNQFEPLEFWLKVSMQNN